VSYTVLARRYRSRDFDELVGQEAIAQTLSNAIAAERTAHAYLFCGTRGVGKTSLARLFAKALNVPPDLAEAEAINDAILRGDDLDVIEIDGASNRGINEARDLIAGAGLSPTRCRFKIYIIDEVHALTKDAFNALLKIMEEPPAHVKFILCTTEPQKVPATIQSRCQRFDFHTIPTAEIARHLAKILETEGIEAEESVVHQVARLGNGSMRDALSLLDRLIASGDRTLTMQRTEALLGLPDHTLLAALVEAIVNRDVRATLEAGDGLLGRGATVGQALDMLAEHFRLLMLVAACGADSDLLDVAPETATAAAEQARHFDVAALVYMIALCDSVGRNARTSATGRALFDAALVRLCLSEHLADVAGLLAGGGDAGPPPRAAPAPAPEPAPAPTAAPATSPERPREQALVEVKSAPPDDDPERLWGAVLSFAKDSPSDHAKVCNLAFSSFDGRTLRLAVAESAARSARFLATQTDSLAELVRRATGRTVQIALESPESTTKTPAASTAEVDDVSRLPLVRKAMDVFDAVVTGVEPDPSAEEPGDVR
jgi:DNA polymerase-3 subunit gamma/tau